MEQSDKLHESLLRHFTFPVLIFLVTFTLYFLTLYQTVPGGDAGELITVARISGVAHPPGYPLYTVIAHLFTMLPWGTVAWRVNLFSALCDAISAALLGASVIKAAHFIFPQARKEVSVGGAVLAAGLFAFSPQVWLYATQAEVFPLNNLFITASLFVFVHYIESKRGIDLCLAALLVGVGLFHQQTFLFIALPLLGSLFQNSRRKYPVPKLLVIGSVLVAAGFVPYLYMVWADHQNPVFSWGSFRTLSGFFTHLFRTEYGTFQLGSSTWKGGRSFWSHFGAYLSDIPRQFLWLFFVLAVPGFYFSRRRFGWLVWSYFSYILVFSLLSNSILDLPIHRAVEARFWEQPNIILYFWMGLGTAWAASRVRWVNAFVLVTVVIVSLQISLHWKQSDQSNNQIVDNFARSLLQSLDPQSILIVTSDVEWNGTQYLQLCENIRPDIHVLSQEMMTYRWMPEKLRQRYPDLIIPKTYSMLAFLEANQRFPLYLSFKFKEREEAEIFSKFELVPAGLSERVLSLQNDERLNRKKWILRAREEWARFDFNNLHASHSSPAEIGSWEYFLEQLTELQRQRQLLFEKNRT